MEEFNKLAESPSNGNSPTAESVLENDSPSSTVTVPSSAPTATATPPAPGAGQPTAQPWPAFLATAKPVEIKQRLAREISEILVAEGLGDYCCLGLLEPDDSINTSDLDAIFSALQSLNGKHEKDVLLLLLCRGGSIEPAYQISKICKASTKRPIYRCSTATGKIRCNTDRSWSR